MESKPTQFMASVLQHE